jgi:hypothetical protein
MSLSLCLEQLELLLFKVQGEACTKLLERVLKNCACFRGRKAFPCLHDQNTILFLLQISIRRDDLRNYLSPYLEDILILVIEFIDQARFIDYDFLHSFFKRMLKIRCSVEEIIDFVQDLSAMKSNNLQRALYCEISKFMTDEILSDVNNFTGLLPLLIDHLDDTS